MRETLITIVQATLAAGVAFAVMVGLALIVSESEAGRNVVLNIFTGLAIWWLITVLQEWRDRGRICLLCQRLNRTRCPVCNTPHQSE